MVDFRADTFLTCGCCAFRGMDVNTMVIVVTIGDVAVIVAVVMTIISSISAVRTVTIIGPILCNRQYSNLGIGSIISAILWNSEYSIGVCLSVHLVAGAIGSNGDVQGSILHVWHINIFINRNYIFIFPSFSCDSFGSNLGR